MRVVVAGASGLIGRAVTRALHSRGDRVVTLGRDAAKLIGLFPGASAFAWDPAASAPPMEAIENADAVVNLIGEPIADRPWTADQKTRIRRSRVVATERLARAIAAIATPPSVLVQGSAIGFYGPRGDDEVDEQAPAGNDFLASVCRDWEAAADGLATTRVVLARTGIVLAREGGALPKLILPFRFFVGGPLGTGRQWMSWIHIDDVAGLILHAIDTPQVRGPLNLVGPVPVRNREVAREIGRALGRPAIAPAPALALRLALGERVDMLLASQRIVPRVARESGYRFRFSDLGEALRDLTQR
ncbi:MAG: TIGR01777 family protein [Chloroflexota bacterium]|nr:MAG: TIGR01777 family protein [Chloroflexota bacterium]